MITTLAFLITAPLAVVAVVGVACGYITAQRDAEIADAGKTLRAISHRGGVTERIPFASPDATVNAPGLVQTQPASQRPAPLPTSLPRTTSAPLSVESPPTQAISDISATPETELKLPIKIADEPTEEEGKIIVEHWETGLSMTKIIFTVWGIKAGGSKAYATARSRYKHYLQELVITA